MRPLAASIFALCGLCAAAAPLGVQGSSPRLPSIYVSPSAAAARSEVKPEFMPVEAIRPGMKGYGLTVFEGAEPERFEVEVLGLLRGVPYPKQTSVIARLSGPQIDRTGVFAGMSGSPVFIEGKLVGAIAFTFAFSKEPIAGITPIKDMIQNVEGTVAEPPRARQPISFRTLVAQTGRREEPATGDTRTLVPIATPVSFSGIPQTVIDLFAGDLKTLGIHPVVGIGGSAGLSPMAPATEATLAPGTSVSVQLVRGDFNVEASGTVTHRDGNRIYAFGHTFLLSGATSWPMAESSVITVVPNLSNSFKISSAGQLVGSIRQDRSTVVFGQLGDRPNMIPARITVQTSRNKTEAYTFEIVSDPVLTPLLTKFTLMSALSATERTIGNQTVTLNGRIAIEGQPDVVLDNAFSSVAGAGLFAAASVERPLAILLNSGFDPVAVQAIELRVTSTDSRSGGSLSRLLVDKTEVRRGETIEIQAFARNDSGSEFVERIPIEIPADAPLGQLVVLIGDGTSIGQSELRAQGSDFMPRDLGQLVRAINKLKKNNRLYVKVMRSGGGAVVNNEEMPTLPPSVLATLSSQRTAGGYVPLSVATIAEQELPPSQFIITGQQSITVNVVK